MKIEWLFPRLASQFGDSGNIRWLRACLPEAQLVETGLNNRPLFLGEAPALIYMGSMSESAQTRATERLLPYRERLSELLEGGAALLFTGNAAEVLGRGVETDEGFEQGLGLLDFSTRRSLNKRFNSFFLGEFGESMPVVGFHSRFTQSEGAETGLFRVVRGAGCRDGAAFEGFRRGNFFATELLGPLLPSNPDLTLHLLGLMGCDSPRLAFEETARAAFARRLAEARDTKRKLD